jgi:rSAM/selenodomain-associated transferase 1
MAPSEVLLLFTKLPRPGLAKTRLCPPLSPEQAAGLHAAFVADCVASARQLMVERPGLEARLWVAPFEDRSPAEEQSLRALGLPLRGQRGAGLGERMGHAIGGSLDEGCGRVVLRGTDSPALPLARLHEAFDALAAPGIDLTLGPDAGGGYYLIGARAPCEALFGDLPLGSASEGDSIFARTLARSAELGLATVQLRAEPDIDLPADLRSLAELLRNEPERAPASARWLSSPPNAAALET